MQGLWSTHRKAKLNLNSVSASTPPSGATTPTAPPPGEAAAPSDAPVEATSSLPDTPAAEVEPTVPVAESKPVSTKRKLRSTRDEGSKRAKLSGAIAKDYSPPSMRLSDLGGVDVCIEKMLELVAMPLCHPEIYLHTGVQPPRGVLLHGPPGCGKTMLAHAIAGELGVPFINVSAPSVVSGMSGESEKTLRDTFEEAKRVAPCLLFIDEIDAITPKRESAQREMERRIVAQFLTCMDDMSWERNENKPVIVIGATNRPDSLDAALRRAGRFDHEISMGVPDEEARAQILRVQSAKLRLEGNFDYVALAKATPGYVGADLAALTGAAGIIAVKRIFNQISEGALELPHDVLPVPPSSATDEDAQMAIDPPAEAQPQPVPQTNDTKLVPFASFDVSKHKAASSIVYFLRAHPDPLTEAQLAPLCITYADFMLALQQVQPSSKREGFATVPDVTWADIGALHATREELHMAIVQPIRRPELFSAVGIVAACGVLLWGPPGCGKTLLAKAVANESRANFISVKGPELLNKYVGESERAVRQVFSRARASSPCVIFFDELDALVPRRDDNMSESSARVVNTLLTELDGLDARKSVYVIAATNRPDMIDPAMCRPGRLDKLLYVDLPSAEERAEIVRKMTRKVPLGSIAAGASPETIQQMVEELVRERCEGYSGADLAALVREAGVAALKRTLGALDAMDGGQLPEQSQQEQRVLVSVDDFLQGLEKVQPSVSVAQRRKYEALRSKFAGLPVRSGKEEDGKQVAG
ncbi:ribosome biogenesis ATPase RIX7 [Cerioporus squamosus]|nr:ribosome biogenesis ATPase RIX7 [Cerioporus squamosus]